MKQTRNWELIGSIAAAAALLLAGTLRTNAGTPPAHLVLAESLVATISPANNVYGTPTEVLWKGTDGPVSKNKSVCSTFVTALLKKAYGFSSSYVKTWLGKSSPSAAIYHDAIETGNGFVRIHEVASLEAGDVIAMEYRDGSASTGHVMIASSTPVDKGLVTKNGVQLRLYEVTVIDSSSSYHGKLDTRYVNKDGASPDNGVGEGWTRIYADPTTGAVAGYSWSTVSASTFYPTPTTADSGRHLVIGRL